MWTEKTGLGHGDIAHITCVMSGDDGICYSICMINMGNHTCIL